ncbi:hypothetical protein SSX86_016923 [Deinandra increscens subsp. villosa]|uniref:BZIP domain-containing protein n=1 Tax=Deinandra increscens subsp. villosa TaxID=3103831 RepID=A0AAP0D1E2_9ASTR
MANRIELEAAEALAGLARVPAAATDGSESVDERRAKVDESNYSKSSCNSYEEAADFKVKSEILPAKSVKDEHNTPSYPTNCVSSGKRSRQNLTEAEMEARKIRRVLANRESARQTIRRRQAVFEELTRKAVDLAWENENLKREKDSASEQYDSLKTRNERLKAQIKMMNNKARETRDESIMTTNEPSVSASSTSSPCLSYIQPSFLPFVWPNSVQLQCGPHAGIVLPSHIPISAANTNKPDSSFYDEGSSISINGSGTGTGTPLYVLPYPWLFTLPQNSNNENRPHSFNLNDKPKESCEYQQFFPEKVKSEAPANSGFPPDGGGRLTTNPVSCEEVLIEHDDTNTVGDNKQVVGGVHQVPVVCSGKRSCDAAAAAEARKRRKQLTRLKNQFHCRQLRMR